jgi:hypothetical protein
VGGCSGPGCLGQRLRGRGVSHRCKRGDGILWVRCHIVRVETKGPKCSGVWLRWVGVEFLRRAKWRLGCRDK